MQGNATAINLTQQQLWGSAFSRRHMSRPCLARLMLQLQVYYYWCKQSWTGRIAAMLRAWLPTQSKAAL